VIGINNTFSWKE